MNELQKLIEKWDEQIALHRRVCEDPLMYTKEDRLKNSHYAQAICTIVDDLKKLTIPAVVGRSEQLPILDRCGCDEPNEEPIKICMNCNGYVELAIAYNGYKYETLPRMTLDTNNEA